MHDLQNFLFRSWVEWLIGHVIKAHDLICTWSTNFLMKLVDQIQILMDTTLCLNREQSYGISLVYRSQRLIEYSSSYYMLSVKNNLVEICTWSTNFTSPNEVSGPNSHLSGEWASVCSHKLQ